MSRAKLVTLVGALALIYPAVRLAKFIPLTPPASGSVIVIPGQGWQRAAAPIFEPPSRLDRTGATTNFDYESVNRLTLKVAEPGWHMLIDASDAGANHFNPGISHDGDIVGCLTSLPHFPQDGALSIAMGDGRGATLGGVHLHDGAVLLTAHSPETPTATASSGTESRITIKFSPADGTSPYVGDFAPDGARSTSIPSIAIYVDKPGTLTVTSNAADQGPGTKTAAMSLKQMSRAELLAEMTNISFSGIVVLAFLLRLTLVPILWGAAVTALYLVSDRCVMTLPRRLRRKARREVHAILAVARWGGYASFLVWTVKDVVEFAFH